MSPLLFTAFEADWVLQDDRLWVDKYEPQDLQDLAVHRRKVDDVRRWLVEAFDAKGRSKHRVGLLFAFLCLKPC
jgi:hypothetical protein